MSRETDKEKADNLMLDMDNLMVKSEFSNYIFFCVGDNKEGGFASVRVTDKDVMLQAQIIDTLRHNKQLYDWIKNIVDHVEK